MAKSEQLTDEQWAILEPLIAEPLRRNDRRGRPWRENREVLDGILCILRTGACWQDLSSRFPLYQTCHRRFQMWVKDGTLKNVLESLAEDLRTRGDLDLSECFIDGTFISKKGASGLERPSRAKVRNSWQWQMTLVYLSPFMQRVLRRMKLDLSAQRSIID